MSAPDLAWARQQDAQDPLRAWRAQFALPRSPEGEELIYLCGHSLGPAPVAARALIDAQVEDWERLGVLGHERESGSWIGFADQLQQPLAALCGAGPDEVVAMNSLSINLHLLLGSFYRPHDTRRAILIEAGAFSSDRHVVAAQLAWHGLDASAELIELAPRTGEDCLRPGDIEQCIAENGPRLALVLWPGVQYLTGQAFDLHGIVRAAHAVGARVGFDLAHAIGNVPLSLHEAGADFAAWCSYKYLNGGPGAIGGAFVHRRHFGDAGLPRLAGWWGHEPTTRFAMRPQFRPAPGAAGWAVSNPSIFAAAPLCASVPMFSQVGMSALRAKSVALTGYLESLVTARTAGQLSVITPRDPTQRGCQLSLRVRDGAGRGREIFGALARAGVIGDWREPDVIRLAPAPLYNRFTDVWQAVSRLCAILEA